MAAVLKEALPDATHLVLAQCRGSWLLAHRTNITDPRLMEEIARETGATIGGTLYSDALSDPSGPAGTYIEMMRHNGSEFSKALTD